jgi:D-glycero-D-manno-heptose 1,7-bisphosphate phosphatase
LLAPAWNGVERHLRKPTDVETDFRMGLARRVGVFLDRDGTLTLPYHHPTRPEHLVPRAGIVGPLRRLADAGVALLIVTNQSALARGLLTGDGFAVAQSSFERKLARAGVRFDGVYHCPHHPDGTVAALAVRCGCRKPEPGLLLRAAAEHGVDLARSWMVGDQPSDVEAGRRAGCRTVLIGQPGQGVTTAQALWRIADEVTADAQS